MTETIPAPPVTRIRPLERLEAEIVELATQITGATARLPAMIGEFDAAEGWRDWGMRSTAHWLSWRCGIGLHAGREQVRVARALRELPAIAQAFASARLTYSKVRAVTRFATAENEAELVDVAESATAAQMERLVAAMRKVRTSDEVRERHAARAVRYHHDDDGSLVGSFRLPPESGAVFLRALDVLTGEIQRLSVEGDVPAGTPRNASTAANAADALVRMAELTIESVSAGTSAEGRERVQLVLHSSVEALAAVDHADDAGGGSELADGTRLHPATARRISCDCPMTEMVDGPDGAAIHVGRRSRRIRGRLLRAVNARDRGRCRAPGCTERATQIHHIRHWANGGPTCLRNLISLCDAHHWLVHEGGFTIVTRSANEWALIGPTGVTIDDRRTEPPTVDPLPHDDQLRSDAVTGTWDGSRMAVAATAAWLASPPDTAVSRDLEPPGAEPEWHVADFASYAERINLLEAEDDATYITF